jgi:uncharacterized protein YbaA (DUF1428 family)
MYIDGFVLPLPTRNTEAYTAMAAHAAKVWMEHGALAYREAILDTSDAPNEFCTSFPEAFRPQEGETIAFAYILYRDKAHRDDVNAKVMADPRMADMPKPEDMPFDCKRMAYNGFQTVVSLGNG